MISWKRDAPAERFPGRGTLELRMLRLALAKPYVIISMTLGDTILGAFPSLFSKKKKISRVKWAQA